MKKETFYSLGLKQGDQVEITLENHAVVVKTLYDGKVHPEIEEKENYLTKEIIPAFPERIAVLAGIESGGTKPIFLKDILSIRKLN